MLVLKLVLIIGAFILSDAALSTTRAPIKSKTFHSEYFDNYLQDVTLERNVEGVVVLKSNLPASVQASLASSIASIYRTTSDQLQRAQQFQTILTKTYPVYWNVIINFDVITYYSQYYILLQVNADRVLAFGLS